jgi:copper(I)-binding protein
MKHVVAALVLLCGYALTAEAQQASGGGIEIEHAWARATPGAAKTGAAYLTLVNKGAEADRLVGAATPVAEATQFHAEINDNGVIKMRRVSAIDLKTGTPVVFKPGVLHIMLVNLKQPLKAGDHFPLTLTFEKAGSKEVEVEIEKAGAPAAGGMGNMKM